MSSQPMTYPEAAGALAAFLAAVAGSVWAVRRLLR